MSVAVDLLFFMYVVGLSLAYESNDAKSIRGGPARNEKVGTDGRRETGGKRLS